MRALPLFLILCLLPTATVAQPAATGDTVAAQRLLDEARRLEQDGQLEPAVREYTLLLERFAGTPQAEEGLLALAHVQRRSGNPALARESAERLVSQYPSSPRAAAAQVLLGEMLAAQPAQPQDLEEARTLFRRVPLLFGRDAYPRLPARGEAQVRAGEVSLRLGDDQAAAADFVVAIEEEPASPWTATARVGLARVLLHQGEWVAAADELQRVVSDRDGNAAPAVVAAARRWLTLVHRLKVRSAAGQPPWPRARLLAVASTQLKKPTTVAADTTGRLVITDEGLDMGLLVNTGGELEGRVEAKGMGHPWWVDERPYLPAGENAYDFLDRTNLRFLAPKGNESKPLDELLAGARGTFGQWYLLDEDRRQVIAFSPQGRYLGVLAEGEPADMAQDPQGRIYILDRKAQTVTRYSADGHKEAVVARGAWRKAEALALDALGSVYVLERDGAQIHIFDPGGEKRSTLGPTLPGGVQLRGPTGIALDGAGRIFVADPKLGAVVVLE